MTAARTKGKTAPAAPNGFDADALLASATIVSRDNNHRETVDVPDAIVAYAQKLYDTKQAAKFPVVGDGELGGNDSTFAEQKLMWQSAGDKTDPPTSATVVAVREVRKDDNGKPVMVGDGDDAAPVLDTVGLRVSFGLRRGQKKNKTVDTGDDGHLRDDV